MVKKRRILIMAAGTGGHVFPAMAIADQLALKGVEIHWMGSRGGMEANLLADSDYVLHAVTVKGLKGKGMFKIMNAPFMLCKAIYESLKIFLVVKPDCVLGMGGFISGPGGIVSVLLKKPLVLHEQNAVAGFTNKILAHFACMVFESFPDTFAGTKINRQVVGNPLRRSIIDLAINDVGLRSADDSLRFLVLGGSQGARAINGILPSLCAEFEGSKKLLVRHQTGQVDFHETCSAYSRAGVDLGDGSVSCTPFIEDIAAAYAWADLVLCRSGASTCSEIAALGLPAIFVPYPFHADKQQFHNAKLLVEKGAAILVPQHELTVNKIEKLLRSFVADHNKLSKMHAHKAKCEILNADQLIAEYCLEIANA